MLGNPAGIGHGAEALCLGLDLLRLYVNGVPRTPEV